MFYGQVAGDPNLQAAALIRTSNTLFYRGRSTFQTNQEALRYVRDISPLLRSRIYSEVSANLAELRQEQEALCHVGLATDSCPDHPEEDPAFPYTHTTQYVIHLNTMIAHLRLDHPRDAWEAINKAGAFVPEQLSSRRMELLKHLVIGSVALGDLERSEHHFDLMVTTAACLGSDYWLSDLHDTYRQMQLKWPHEQHVRKLAERLRQ